MSATTRATGTFGASTSGSVTKAGDAPAPRPSFAVVIPMYNEQLAAERCVRLVCQSLRQLPHRSRLIAVNDGSADRTGDLLAVLALTEPLLHVVTHEHNAGYGSALQTGAGAAHEQGFVYTLFMDADLTNAPEDIARFAEQMNDGADVIKATRYREGGGMRGVPWRRRCISVVGARIACLLFRLPLSDCTNGFRAVKTRLRVGMTLTERGFPVIVEELYHCVFVARRFREIPVVLGNRAGDLRQTSFPYRPSTFYRYLKYCVLACCRVPPAALYQTRGSIDANEL